MRHWFGSKCIALACGISALSLASCNKLGLTSRTDDPVRAVAKAPQENCVSTETQDAVRRIILDKATKLLGNSSVTIDRDQMGKALEFQMVTLSRVDDQIGKITCAAQVKLAIPANAKANMRTFDEFQRQAPTAAMLSVPFFLAHYGATDLPTASAELLQDDPNGFGVTYDRQITADGAQFVVSVSEIDPVASAVVYLALAEKAASTSQTNASLDSPPRMADISGAPAEIDRAYSAGGMNSVKFLIQRCFDDLPQGASPRSFDRCVGLDLIAKWREEGAAKELNIAPDSFFGESESVQRWGNAATKLGMTQEQAVKRINGVSKLASGPSN